MTTTRSGTEEKRRKDTHHVAEFKSQVDSRLLRGRFDVIFVLPILTAAL